MKSHIPNIYLDEFGFEGSIPLEIHGKIKKYDLSIETDMDIPTILNEQIDAYHYLINNTNIIYDKIIKLILEDYSNIKEEYEKFSDVIGPPPVIDTISDMILNLSLIRIHIMKVNKDGFAFIGFEFNCTWDIEHGVGVMTHKDVVLETGSADISFLNWVAEQYLD